MKKLFIRDNNFMSLKSIFLFCLLLFSSSVCSQIDPALLEKSKLLFDTNNTERGTMVVYSMSPISNQKTFYNNGFRSKSIRTAAGFDYFFEYYDAAWHKDGFWYEINLDSLNSSKYFFVNKNGTDKWKGNQYIAANTVEYIEPSKLTFIDSIVISHHQKTISLYKFKSTHIVQDSFKVCMIHIISEQYGLIARESNVWFCDMKSARAIMEGPKEYIYCPFEDRNHFSILNTSDQFYLIERKFRRPVKIERPDWIYKSLRQGNPIDQSILNFYNDEISCNCDFDDLMSGHLKALNNDWDKAVKKRARYDKIYYNGQLGKKKYP